MAKNKNVTKKTSVSTSKKSGTKTSVKSVPSANPMESHNDAFLDEFTKVRRMSLQLYCPPERWGAVLFSAKHYAYIYHDKDINEDGSSKTPHYHLLLVFENARYRNSIYNLFDLSNCDDTTINFQKLINTKQAFQYLRHNTADAQKDKKYLYAPEEVICDDINFWEDITAVSTLPNEDFLTDLQTLSIKDMALRYGRDYIKNYQRYDSFKRTLDYERKLDKKRDDLAFVERVLKTSNQLDGVVCRAVAQCLGECANKLVVYDGYYDTGRGLAPTRQMKEVVTEILWRIEDEIYNYLREVYEA